MNPNRKAAIIAVASVAALTVLLGAPVTFASPSEWDDQNSDTSWTSSSPVVAPASDPVETDPAPAAANAPSVPVATIATPPAEVTAAPAPSAPSAVSAIVAPVDSASIPATDTQAVDITPRAVPVPSKLTSISKTPADTSNVVSQSPYVHSGPRAAAPFPILLNDAVQDYVQYFVDQPAGLRLAFERSRPFMRDMVELLKKQGLPDDLVYLTFAESGFTKRGKGPWQFTAGTAARFGLRVNKWIDERRDPILSTKAAAEYLAELHDQADNDWRVAIIGWNTGEGNLERYWLLQGPNYTKFADRLPRRTRQLLNRFMAVAFIAHNSETYGIGEVKYSDSPAWTIEKVRGGTLLSSIARKFETTVAKLRDLNPALRADRVPPTERTFSIRIPNDD